MKPGQRREPKRSLPEAASLYAHFKPSVEWAAALVILVLASPVMVVLAIVVRITSAGPAFYSQVRLGKGGREYRVHKFRTMLHQCEQATGAVWAIHNDPRVTPVGRFLRETHLDELPQLWNVLRGEMSLIGPRPERPEIAVKLERLVPAYRLRLRTRPGMTGLAQLRLPPDRDVGGVRRKLAHDLYYVRRVGLLLDLQLLLATTFYMVARFARSLSVVAIRSHGRRAELEEFGGDRSGEAPTLELQLSPIASSRRRRDERAARRGARAA